MTQERGKVISVEGLDGSGKQTQTKLLVDRMRKAGFKVLTVSFPNYDKESSVLVKKYLKGDYSNLYDKNNLTFVKQMSSFYAVDRVSSFIEKTYDGKSLIEHLNEGTYIVCDRYTTSNILHQSGNLKDKDDVVDYVRWIEDLEYNQLGLPRPDAVLYLDVLPEISVANIKERYKGEAKEDIHESLDHLNSVYAVKNTVISLANWIRVDCCPRGKQESIEWIHDLVVFTLKEKMKILAPEFSIL